MKSERKDLKHMEKQRAHKDARDMIRKFIFTVWFSGITMTVDGKAPNADSTVVSYPGYPKANVEYFSRGRCVAENPDSCVTCYKTTRGTWVALAKFPTLIDNGQRAANVYWTLEELYAINGIDTHYAVDSRCGMYYVPGRGGKCDVFGANPAKPLVTVESLRQRQH